MKKKPTSKQLIKESLHTILNSECDSCGKPSNIVYGDPDTGLYVCSKCLNPQYK